MYGVRGLKSIAKVITKPCSIALVLRYQGFFMRVKIMKKIKNFEFNGFELVIIGDDKVNNPLFIAADICEFLGIKNASQAIASLDDDEKLTSLLMRSGQNRDMAIVNESGLYSLIFKSRKPDAKAFRKWITSEVLPTIRRTGSFIDDNQALTTLDKNEIYQNLTNRIALLESAITPTQLTIINATEELPKRLKDVYDFDTPAGFWTEKTMMVDLFYSAFTDGEISTIPLKKGIAMLISALTALNCKFKHGKHFVLLPPKKTA